MSLSFPAQMQHSQPCVSPALQGAPSADQVEDQHDNSDDDEDVDQPATDVKGESQKPQDK